MYIHSQIVVQVRVDELVYDLIGEISSSSDGSETDSLEYYLLSNLQGMARTKQTERKEQNSRQTTVRSAGGFFLALGDPHSSSGEDSIVAAANQLSSSNEMASCISPRK